MKNIIYYNLVSHQVKTALHVIFDEAMTDSDLNLQMPIYYVVILSYLQKPLTLLLHLHASIFPFANHYSYDS